RATSGPLTPAPSELLGRVFINSARRFCPGELNSPPISRHHSGHALRSALGPKPTYALQQIAVYSITSSARPSSERANLTPSTLAGDEIKDQFAFGRLLDGQVGVLFAHEDTADIDAAETTGLDGIRAIAHEASSVWEIARCVDRRHPMAQRQGRELL